jgi:hypothetical protein
MVDQLSTVHRLGKHCLDYERLRVHYLGLTMETQKNC